MYYFCYFAHNKTCFEYNLTKNKRNCFPIWNLVRHRILIFEFDSKYDMEAIPVVYEKLFGNIIPEGVFVLELRKDTFIYNWHWLHNIITNAWYYNIGQICRIYIYINITVTAEL